MNTILFSSSKAVEHLVPTVSVTLAKQTISFGMPKLPTDAQVIMFGPENPSKKAVYEQIGQHTLIDKVNSMANLNKIGILKADNKLSNVLLDAQGRAYIADFSCSTLVKTLTEDFYSERHVEDEIFLTNLIS